MSSGHTAAPAVAGPHGLRLSLWLVLLLLLSGCATQEYVSAPLDVQAGYQRLHERGLDSIDLREFLHSQGYETETWPRAEWDAEGLVLAALYLNPDIEVALARWQLRQAGEITAAQRINPNLNLPLEWHTDASDGSPWLIGIVLDLVFERSGKREARIERAEWQTAAARVAIEQVAWQVRSEVYAALTELTAARDRGQALEQRISVVNDILNILQRRQALGQLAAYELSSNRLELQRLRLQLSQQQRLIDAARNRLAAAIGIAPAQFERVTLRPSPAPALPVAATLPVLDIQGLALRSRYDIRTALMEYAAQEAALRLQIEQQYPDITLSPGFVFDQGDKVWELGTAWLVPLFHNHEGQIAEALARRHLLQMQFIDLQATIMARVAAARSDYLGHLQTYKESQQLQADAADYRRQIKQQLDAGYANRLQYLRAGQVAVEAEKAIVDSRAAAQQAYRQLEQTLQYELGGHDRIAAVVAYLINNNKVMNNVAGQEGGNDP